MRRVNSKKTSQVTVIVTVLNERKTIAGLLRALSVQTLLPIRVVVIDGGSTDGTDKVVKQVKSTLPFELVWDMVPGNRSVGRNAAIKRFVDTELVAITDAGCLPEKAWLAELVAAYERTHSPVIAGYYRVVDTASPFQLAAAPFFLVMPDQVNESTFLPATRSMLLEKKVWVELGGFDERLSDNEDYAFAKEIARRNIAISFASDAVVAWQPPADLRRFWQTIYRFARGDVQAGLYRPKVALIFARYLVVVVLLWFIALQSWLSALVVASALLLLYSVWSIGKLWWYVPQGKWWLPLLQITADGAVICGSVVGGINKVMPR